MCWGSPAISFFQGTNKTIRLTNHHGTSVRCPLWDTDVVIEDVYKWISWFDARGINFIGDEVEEARAFEKKRRQKEWEQWQGSAPEVLQPLFHSLPQSYGSFNISSLRKMHIDAITDKHKRILSLLNWYGSGAGPWIEYPSYETLPEKMLLYYSTKNILEAISSTDLSSAQLEGTARLFCGDSFNLNRPQELNELSLELRQQLWKYMLRAVNMSKLGMACKLIDFPPSKTQGSKLVEGSWVYEENGAVVNFLTDGTVIAEESFPIRFEETSTWEYRSIARLSLNRPNTSSSRGITTYCLLRLDTESLEMFCGSHVLKLKRKQDKANHH